MSREEVEKLERKLGWVKDYPHCVFITLIQEDKRPSCNLCNNNLCSVCALEDIQKHSQK